MEESILKQVYLHAFVAYCYNNGKTGPGDLITPLVKKVIASFYKERFTTKDIHGEIIKSFSKDFPMILIEREMHKLSSMNIIQRDYEGKQESEYTLIADLTEISRNFTSSQNETSYFLSEFRNFLQIRKSSYSDLKLASLLKRIETFCIDNMIPIINYFGKIEPVIKGENIEKDIDLLIKDFLNGHVNHDSRLMVTFENIFNGINLLYLFENCSEEISNSDHSFNEKCFYLDTNILLRILGLQNDYLNRLGNELYTFLIKNKFTIKVFEITLEELAALIRGYEKACKYLVKGKNISHVYQILKNKGYEAFQIDDIIDMINNKLIKLNIEIDNSTKWNPSDYKEFEDNIENLAKQKAERRIDDEIRLDIYDETIKRYTYQAKHDMRCIELIRSLRNNITKNKFEDEKYFFITAESLLLYFNKSISEKVGIKETIGDFSLCFLLYFHDPKNLKGIALNTFIAANYNNTDLSVSNWIKYVQVIHKKYKNGEINVKQMGYLFTKTILNNNRFETEDLGDIINESLSEYEKMESQYESFVTEKKKADDENEKLREENTKKISEIMKQSEIAGKLFERVDILENAQSDLKSKVSELRQQMRLIRKILFVVFTVVIAIAVAIFFSNKIAGTVLFVLGLLLDILNIIDSYKKILIKD